MRPWQKLARTALEWLYPDRCELCLRIGRPAICLECLKEMVPLDDPVQRHYSGNPLDFTASVYPFEGRAAQAAKRLKYSRATALAGPMARMLQEAYGTLPLPEVDSVVPVPIHWARKCARGFNQSELLCGDFPQGVVHASSLSRIRSTRPQVGLTRDQRLTNLKGAFKADPIVDGQRLLLIDDVTTSGGTATACAEALKASGAALVGILTFCGERQTYSSDVIRP